MHRVEQLTGNLLCGVLDGAGLAELEHLLASDETARSIHFGLCDQQAVLHGCRSGVDLHRQAVDRLRAALPHSGQSQAAEPVKEPTSIHPGPWAKSAPGDAVADEIATNDAQQQPVAVSVVDEEELEEDGYDSWASPRTLIATLSSMLVHLLLMIALGLWMLPPLEGGITLSFLSADEVIDEEDPFETVVLSEDTRPAADMVMAGADAPTPAAAAGGTGSLGLPVLKPIVIEGTRISARTASSRWTPTGIGVGDLMAEVSSGSPTSTSVAVDDYRQALDRITQEILKMLAKRKVLLIWCFDQSESMKDDQQEIRSRIELVYDQLGALGAISGDELTTAVTSYGEDFAAHTRKPTTSLDEIRAAIDAVPVDPSGKEMMCRAISDSIARCRPHAATEHRQMALILVTDESGQQEESRAYLESTVENARAIGCKIFVLGREAVFGYPYAKVRWVHPDTGQVHLLPVDRGPETAVVEQLQTEGFQARTDAHPSGFGPYAQSRLARETGGLFFMLPSREANLVQDAAHRYDRVALQAYQPDLRSREEIVADYRQRPLPALICKIIEDLNPYNEESAAMMKMAERFPSGGNALASSLQKARTKADRYLVGLLRGVEELDRQEPLRDKEPSRRWQANYDLIRAQLVAYAARTQLYRKALDAAVEKLPQTPPVLPDNQRLVAWRVRRRAEVPIDEPTAEMLARAKQLYETVIENHPGTPWAARAQWELRRDFGYPGALDAEIAANDHTGTGQNVTVDATVPQAVGGSGGGSGGMELFAVYRAPTIPHAPGAGGRPARPRDQEPRPAPTPPPKL